MPTRHCAWGQCKSDSRKKEENVTFFKFPKPCEWGGKVDETSNIYKQCQQWVKACGRPQTDLNMDRIIDDYKRHKYSFYICSKVINSIISPVCFNIFL